MWRLALLVGGSLVAGVAIAAALDLQLTAGSGLYNHLIDFFRVVAAALFFGAGMLRISCWRITGESRSALMGIALVNFGALTFPLSNVAELIHASDAAVTLSPLTRMMTTSVTLAFVVMALRAPQHNPRLRPGRLTVVGAALTMSGFLALVVARAAFGVQLDPTAAVHQGLELTMANGWFAVAIAAVWRGQDAGWARRVAPLLAGMGVVGLFRTAAVDRLDGWGLAAAALGAIIAGVTLASATNDLGEATSHESGRMLAVKEALVRAEEAHLAHQAWREEMSHDAGNAIAGLRGALTTLAKYGEQLDAPTRHRLRNAVLGELGHLGHLIDRPDADEPVEFDLEQVLESVVEAQRAAGLPVSLDVTSCLALGRPGDVATVVRNLLVNAGRHCSGASVTVRVRDLGNQVQIHVEDCGPGVPDAQRHELFDRGVRGLHSTGSGLGLYVARTLMREQDGDIELRDRAGTGSVFVVTLPTGRPALTLAPKRVERRNVNIAIPRQRRPQGAHRLHGTVNTA